MPAAEQLELRRRRAVARLAMVLRHHGAVLAHFVLVLHILLREPVRLLIQEQRGDGVNGEGQPSELLAQVGEPVLLREQCPPLGGGEGGGRLGPQNVPDLPGVMITTRPSPRNAARTSASVASPGKVP